MTHGPLTRSSALLGQFASPASPQRSLAAKHRDRADRNAADRAERARSVPMWPVPMTMADLRGAAADDVRNRGYGWQLFTSGRASFSKGQSGFPVFATGGGPLAISFKPHRPGF